MNDNVQMLWLNFGVIVQQQNMKTPHMKTNSKAIIFQQSDHNQVWENAYVYICVWMEWMWSSVYGDQKARNWEAWKLQNTLLDEEDTLFSYRWFEVKWL